MVRFAFVVGFGLVMFICETMHLIVDFGAEGIQNYSVYFRLVPSISLVGFGCRESPLSTY